MSFRVYKLRIVFENRCGKLEKLGYPYFVVESRKDRKLLPLEKSIVVWLHNSIQYVRPCRAWTLTKKTRSQPRPIYMNKILDSRMLNDGTRESELYSLFISFLQRIYSNISELLLFFFSGWNRWRARSINIYFPCASMKTVSVPYCHSQWTVRLTVSLASVSCSRCLEFYETCASNALVSTDNFCRSFSNIIRCSEWMQLQFEVALIW